MNEIDKLAWICIKDRKLLAARSKGKDLYYIPGGKREPGESDQEALIREIKEELSIDLILTTIKHAGIFKAQADKKPNGVLVKMTCYFADFTGEIQAASEIDEAIWLNYANKKQCSSVTKVIMDWLKSEEMIT